MNIMLLRQARKYQFYLACFSVLTFGQLDSENNIYSWLKTCLTETENKEKIRPSDENWTFSITTAEKLIWRSGYILYCT